MDTADLNRLPVSEKLKLATKLWDDIAASSEEIIVPPEVIAEAKLRSLEIKIDPSMAIDDEELWRRVDG
jgi:putative addiction module component (TIGR02574 family)